MCPFEEGNGKDKMKNRIDRINEEVRQVLAKIIKNLKDPRIAEWTSVSAVEVSGDMKHAKAYVSVLGDEQAQEDTLMGLKSAEGFIRKEVGQQVDLRFTPEFSFHLDKSIETGAHINKLLHEVMKDD